MELSEHLAGFGSIRVGEWGLLSRSNALASPWFVLAVVLLVQTLISPTVAVQHGIGCNAALVLNYYK